VYYRVYSSYDLLTVKEPVSAADPFLGGLQAFRIPPPHTAGNIKRCLSKKECLPQDAPIELFAAISSLAPLDDRDLLHIQNQIGPGSGPGDPLALVVRDVPFSSATTLETSLSELPSLPNSRPKSMSHVYKMRATHAFEC
jgi:hypothetical protein